jgi:hypothetical protein
VTGFEHIFSNFMKELYAPESVSEIIISTLLAAGAKNSVILQQTLVFSKHAASHFSTIRFSHQASDGREAGDL